MSAPLLFFALLVVAAYLALPVYLLRQRRRAAFGLSLIPLAVAGGILLAAKPPHAVRLEKFADDAKHALDPFALRKWALAKLATADPNADSSLLPSDQVPARVRNLRSQHSDFHGAMYHLGESPERSSIELWWSDDADRSHWGLVVGAPAFHPGDDACYVEWQPGIYFWHDLPR